MRELAYAGMLVFVLVVTLPLELLLGARVYARWRRLALTILCAGTPFLVWDLFATAAGHWSFDLTQTLGVVVPGDLPLEEVLFFVVIPIASVLTLESVRRLTGWGMDDAPAPSTTPSSSRGER